VFCEESYNIFSTLLSFITKLNSNQLNIKKIKLTKIILGKNITKKKTQKKPEKNCGKKHYVNSQKFARKVTVFFSHIITVIFNQLNIKK